MIACCACTCGSADKKIRTRLEKHGYKDALTIPIPRGKEKSNRMINSLPQFPEINMLREHLKKTSKFTVIIGYDEHSCKWVDLSNGNGTVIGVEAELIIKQFA